MAQFGFENDIHSILKLDMPITNAPMARWQRKASSSNAAALSGLSPGKSANASLGSSKTPSKTPGKRGPLCSCPQSSPPPAQMSLPGFTFVPTGKNKKVTPSKMGGDRFIPTRNSKQMDVASFLLSKENEPVDANNSTSTAVRCRFNRFPSSLCGRFLLIRVACVCLQESQKAWSMSLNGYNLEDAKILHLGGKPLNAPEGKDVCVSV